MPAAFEQGSAHNMLANYLSACTAWQPESHPVHTTLQCAAASLNRLLHHADLSFIAVARQYSSVLWKPRTWTPPFSRCWQTNSLQYR